MTESGKPKRQRRWLQYSLRTFLLLVAVFSVWLAIEVNKAQKQRAAVVAVEAAGGTVYYDWQDGEFLQVEFKDRTLEGYRFRNGPPRGPRWLRNAIGSEYVQEVVHVTIDDAALSDEMMLRLKSLPALESMFVTGPRTTDVENALPKVKVYRPASR